MLAEIVGINVRQAFMWCTVLSAASCAFAAIRIKFLPSSRDYGLIFWLLAFWFVIGVSTLGVPPSSHFYFYIFASAVPLSWLLYFFTAKYLYQTVFSRYPGIAFAGCWSLIIAAIAVVAGVPLSVALSPGGLTKSLTFSTLMLLDRFALFGIAFFLSLLVGVIVKYPIAIAKNIAIHSMFFGSILFFQTAFQIADQWTLYRHTALFNVFTAGCDAVLAGSWALFLTNAGDTAIIRIRQHMRRDTELQLLGQLDALNGILLRAARK